MASKRIVIRAELCQWVGYGDHLRLMVSALESFGYDIAIRPNAIHETLGGRKFPIPPLLRKNIVQKVQQEEWEVLLSAPHQTPTPGKRTAYFSMWECSQLPKWAVANLNRSDVVVVPCDWNAHCFKASGVTPPIHVSHLGQDDKVYYHRPMDVEGKCVFGVAGRLRHGGTRKGVNEAIQLFERAFPNEDDVELRIKSFPDDPLDALPKDSRIGVIRDYISDFQMAEWLGELTCFIALAKAEGWGAIQHQAMAIGRPVIGPIFSGVEMFMTPENSFPVDYELGKPPKGNYYDGQGFWAIPDDTSAIEQMHRAYIDRSLCQRKGFRASVDMASKTHIHSGRVFESILREFGVV